MIEITLPSGIRVSVSSVAEAKELLNGEASGHKLPAFTPDPRVEEAIRGMDAATGARPAASQRGKRELVSDPEFGAKVWALRNSGSTLAEIGEKLGAAKSTVSRILTNKGHTPSPKGAAPAPEPVTSLVAPVKGRGHPANLIYEAAAAVIKAGKPVTAKQLRRLGGVTKGSINAINGRLARAVEEGLIQRVTAGHYAPPDYKRKNWEFTSMTREQAIEIGRPLVRFMTEHPEMTLRATIAEAATKAGVSGTAAAAQTRLWAAYVTGMVEGRGFDRPSSPPLKVTDFGLEEAAKGDSDA